jgi:hypothetical protein
LPQGGRLCKSNRTCDQWMAQAHQIRNFTFSLAFGNRI